MLRREISEQIPVTRFRRAVLPKPLLLGFRERTVTELGSPQTSSGAGSVAPVGAKTQGPTQAGGGSGRRLAGRATAGCRGIDYASRIFLISFSSIPAFAIAAQLF